MRNVFLEEQYHVEQVVKEFVITFTIKNLQ